MFTHTQTGVFLQGSPQHGRLSFWFPLNTPQKVPSKKRPKWNFRGSKGSPPPPPPKVTVQIPQNDHCSDEVKTCHGNGTLARSFALTNQIRLRVRVSFDHVLDFLGCPSALWGGHPSPHASCDGQRGRNRTSSQPTIKTKGIHIPTSIDL